MSSIEKLLILYIILPVHGTCLLSRHTYTYGEPCGNVPVTMWILQILWPTNRQTHARGNIINTSGIPSKLPHADEKNLLDNYLKCSSWFYIILMTFRCAPRTEWILLATCGTAHICISWHYEVWDGLGIIPVICSCPARSQKRRSQPPILRKDCWSCRSLPWPRCCDHPIYVVSSYMNRISLG